jgi:Fe2+ transport system protein FeoA
MSLSLSELQPQDEAVVLHLPKEEPVATRLREMGLLPGTTITFVRRAPLGDPLEIRLRGYSLSLRHQEAASIIVKKMDAPSS